MSTRETKSSEPEREPMNAGNATQLEETDQRVAMERQLGLLDGVAMVVGTIVGSGFYTFHCLAEPYREVNTELRLFRNFYKPERCSLISRFRGIVHHRLDLVRINFFRWCYLLC